MSKTPRTLLENYMDASKTQTVKVSRNKPVGLEETPRQLLQGFLESEDTTAPLVRYTSRTSQGRLSSSQPAVPVSGRRSSQSRPGNWTVDIDSDTPRTLLQKYVLNTTAAIETPAIRHSVPQQQTPELPIQQATYHTPRPKKVQRKPRQKSQYTLPVNIVKKQFTHLAVMRVSKEAIEEVMKVSEKYWDNLAKDLEAYAKHAGRKQINMSDFVLLFKRQGHVTETESLKSLIEKYLPMEEREKLIPVARAGNRIEPKL